MTNNNQKLNNVIQQCRETGVKLPESMLAVVANLLSSTPLSFAVFPTLRQSIQIEHKRKIATLNLKFSMIRSLC